MKHKSVSVLAALILASACVSGSDRTVNFVNTRQWQARNGVELAIETFNAAGRRYRDTLEILSTRAKGGDPIAEQAYAEIIIWWYKRPEGQGEPSVSIEIAWENYRSAATKSRSAFSWLRAYYLNGAPGLPSNPRVADCMLQIWMQKRPLSDVTRCYSI